ncbi:MAG: nucleoside-diphosphate kinase [Planctomycetota bacterium]|jgi:nucleoside-diphosphate kinase
MNHPNQEKTFVLVKPDGVQKGLIGEIIKRFEQRHLKVVALEMFQANTDQIDNHYPKDDVWITRLGGKAESTYTQYGYSLTEDFGTEDQHIIGLQIRSWLLEYMTAAPMVRMIVQGVHAIDMVRKVCGQTLPYLADMGTIRGDFSNDSPALSTREKRAIFNLIHASENPEEATAEIAFWFGSPNVALQYKRFGVDLD